jgi:hypothetical protein
VATMDAFPMLLGCKCLQSGVVCELPHFLRFTPIACRIGEVRIGWSAHEQLAVIYQLNIMLAHVQQPHHHQCSSVASTPWANMVPSTGSGRSGQQAAAGQHCQVLVSATRCAAIILTDAAI